VNLGWKNVWEQQTCKDKIKKIHILSKLRNMCQNERISTKLIFPIQWTLPADLSSCITTNENKYHENWNSRQVFLFSWISFKETIQVTCPCIFTMGLTTYSNRKSIDVENKQIKSTTKNKHVVTCSMWSHNLITMFNSWRIKHTQIVILYLRQLLMYLPRKKV
jgi:hypothetical protein